MSILYKKDQGGNPTEVKANLLKQSKDGRTQVNSLEDMYSGEVNNSSYKFNPNYNQSHPNKTSDGRTVYIIPDTVESRDQDDIFKFDDGLSYTENEKHVFNLGNYSTVQVDDSGNPSFLSNSSGSSDRVRQLLHGKLSSDELIYK